MKVYTIQHLEVLKEIKSLGVYKTNTKHICEETFIFAYNWLNGEAKKRVPHWDTHRPIWVWVDKPDLRAHRHIYSSEHPKKSKHVLLTLEIPEESVLFSEFALWHNVLNHYPVPHSKKEADALDKILKPYENLPLDKYPPKILSLVFKTWERILKTKDNDFKKFTDYILDNKNLKFQGIINHIDKSMVVDSKVFTMINTYRNKK